MPENVVFIHTSMNMKLGHLEHLMHNNHSQTLDSYYVGYDQLVKQCAYNLVLVKAASLSWK